MKIVIKQSEGGRGGYTRKTVTVEPLIDGVGFSGKRDDAGRSFDIALDRRCAEELMAAIDLILSNTTADGEVVH